MKLVTHKPNPVHGHFTAIVNLSRQVRQRLRSLGLNTVQINAMMTDPNVSPLFFAGRAVIVVRDCNCCGDKQVFAMVKNPNEA